MRCGYSSCLSFLFDNGVRDLGFSGPRFTWSRGNLSQHLGRVMCNLIWDSFALNCSIRNLHRLKLDHRPILVSLNPLQNRGNRPFRYLANWLLHAEFNGLVSNSWKYDMDVISNLELFKKKKKRVQEWNKHVFGNIFV
ncbi:hypothetical protein ES288_D05G432000v1 [Gossypium darwinii]|uniref:Endonuclease/exonuclease/phosphatase domain-containing protein n=1 Tax=Gossypium darwinii TaxID=34276 RepID=A0A5D2CQD0_GOSDA|nr:hypothetical protein ES288_D05G432000v1 [Gossypium darwinii]